ncbi:MAG: hypothetical protein ACPKPY_07905 [Nitrososphaeraceae archaeon]
MKIINIKSESDNKDNVPIGKCIKGFLIQSKITQKTNDTKKK